MKFYVFLCFFFQFYLFVFNFCLSFIFFLRFLCLFRYIFLCDMNTLLFHVFGQEIVDFLTLLQSFLHVNQVVDTINDLLNKLNLRMSETIQVGDIKGSTNSSRVDTSSTTFLETVRFKNVVKTFVLSQFGKLDVNSCKMIKVVN